MPSNCPLLTADPLGDDFTITCRPEHGRAGGVTVAPPEESGFAPQVKTLIQEGRLPSAILAKDGTSIQNPAGFATSMTMRIHLGTSSP